MLIYMYNSSGHFASLENYRRLTQYFFTRKKKIKVTIKGLNTSYTRRLYYAILSDYDIMLM